MSDNKHKAVDRKIEVMSNKTSSERVIDYLERPRTSANGVTPSIDSSANPNPYAAVVDGLLSEEALEKSMELTPPSSQTLTTASAPASTHSSSNPPSSLRIPYFHRSPINMDMSAPIPLPASHGCILNAYGEPIPLVASPTDAIVCSHELLPIGMSITFEPVGLTKSLTQFYNKMKKQCTLDDMANTWCPHVKEYERIRFYGVVVEDTKTNAASTAGDAPSSDTKHDAKADHDYYVKHVLDGESQCPRSSVLDGIFGSTKNPADPLFALDSKRPCPVTRAHFYENTKRFDSTENDCVSIYFTIALLQLWLHMKRRWLSRKEYDVRVPKHAFVFDVSDLQMQIDNDISPILPTIVDPEHNDPTLPESQRVYQWNTLSGHRLARASAVLSFAQFIHLVQMRLNMHQGPSLIVPVKSVEFFKKDRIYRFFAMNFLPLSIYGPENRNVKIYESKKTLTTREKLYVKSVKPTLLDEIIKAALRKHLEVPLTDAESQALKHANHFTSQRKSRITSSMVDGVAFEHKSCLPSLVTQQRYDIKNNSAIPNIPEWLIHTYFRPDHAAFDYSAGPQTERLSTILWQLARYMTKDCITKQNTICKNLFPPNHTQTSVDGSLGRTYFRPECEPTYLRVSGPLARYLVYREGSETEWYYAHPRHIQKDRGIVIAASISDYKQEKNGDREEDSVQKPHNKRKRTAAGSKSPVRKSPTKRKKVNHSNAEGDSMIPSTTVYGVFHPSMHTAQSLAEFWGRKQMHYRETLPLAKCQQLFVSSNQNNLIEQMYGLIRTNQFTESEIWWIVIASLSHGRYQKQLSPAWSWFMRVDQVLNLMAAEWKLNITQTIECNVNRIVDSLRQQRIDDTEKTLMNVWSAFSPLNPTYDQSDTLVAIHNRFNELFFTTELIQQHIGDNVYLTDIGDVEFKRKNREQVGVLIKAVVTSVKDKKSIDLCFDNKHVVDLIPHMVLFQVTKPHAQIPEVIARSYDIFQYFIDSWYKKVKEPLFLYSAYIHNPPLGAVFHDSKVEWLASNEPVAGKSHSILVERIVATILVHMKRPAYQEDINNLVKSSKGTVKDPVEFLVGLIVAIMIQSNQSSPEVNHKMKQAMQGALISSARGRRSSSTDLIVASAGASTDNVFQSPIFSKFMEGVRSGNGDAKSSSSSNQKESIDPLHRLLANIMPVPTPAPLLLMPPTPSPSSPPQQTSLSAWQVPQILSSSPTTSLLGWKPITSAFLRNRIFSLHTLHTISSQLLLCDPLCTNAAELIGRFLATETSADRSLVIQFMKDHFHYQSSASSSSVVNTTTSATIQTPSLARLQFAFDVMRFYIEESKLSIRIVV